MAYDTVCDNRVLSITTEEGTVCEITKFKKGQTAINKTFDSTGKLRNVVKLCAKTQNVINRVPTLTK